MCVRAILDASVFRHFTSKTKDSAGDQFRKWLDREDGMIVYTTHDKYHAELRANSEVYALLRNYFENGNAISVDLTDIESALNKIPAPPTRRSNDPHILALALASGATVLFSGDKRLRRDFSNSKVIPRVKQQRKSLPGVDERFPEDTTSARGRKRFLNSRRCTSC